MRGLRSRRRKTYNSVSINSRVVATKQLIDARPGRLNGSESAEPRVLSLGKDLEARTRLYLNRFVKHLARTPVFISNAEKRRGARRFSFLPFRVSHFASRRRGQIKMRIVRWRTINNRPRTVDRFEPKPKRKQTIWLTCGRECDEGRLLAVSVNRIDKQKTRFLVVRSRFNPPNSPEPLPIINSGIKPRCRLLHMSSRLGRATEKSGAAPTFSHIPFFFPVCFSFPLLFYCSRAMHQRGVSRWIHRPEMFVAGSSNVISHCS